MESRRPAAAWDSGDAYELYVGRWSRRVAREFLTWLAMPPGIAWLDVGCGTGALSQAILETSEPAEVTGIDRSESFVDAARGNLAERGARFDAGDAQALPYDASAFDVVVSALAINFIPDAGRAVREMARVAKAGGRVAAYVWDYAQGMQMMRHFWDAAMSLDADASAMDEGSRLGICQPGPLEQLFAASGLEHVEVRPIDIPTTFADFDDYWTPFLGAQGSAPGYVVSLNEEQRAALRERVRSGLPVATDGSISLTARAWAVRGIA